MLEVYRGGYTFQRLPLLRQNHSTVPFGRQSSIVTARDRLRHVELFRGRPTCDAAQVQRRVECPFDRPERRRLGVRDESPIGVRMCLTLWRADDKG